MPEFTTYEAQQSVERSTQIADFSHVYDALNQPEAFAQLAELGVASRDRLLQKYRLNEGIFESFSADLPNLRSLFGLQPGSDDRFNRVHVNPQIPFSPFYDSDENVQAVNFFSHVAYFGNTQVNLPVEQIEKNTLLNGVEIRNVKPEGAQLPVTRILQMGRTRGVNLSRPEFNNVAHPVYREFNSTNVNETWHHRDGAAYRFLHFAPLMNIHTGQTTGDVWVSAGFSRFRSDTFIETAIINVYDFKPESLASINHDKKAKVSFKYDGHVLTHVFDAFPEIREDDLLGLGCVAEAWKKFSPDVQE